MLAESRNPGAGGTAAGASGAVQRGSGHPEATPTRSLDQGFTEFLSEPELRDVRAVWWRLRAAGVDLPAERGVVTLNGGAR
jgi:hypothetical protein